MGNNKHRSLYRLCDLNISSPPSSLIVGGALHVVHYVNYVWGWFGVIGEERDDAQYW